MKLLRLFYYFDLNRLGKISVKDETKKELKKVIDAYYDEYSGLSLNSKRFLSQLDNLKGKLTCTVDIKTELDYHSMYK